MEKNLANHVMLNVLKRLSFKMKIRCLSINKTFQEMSLDSMQEEECVFYRNEAGGFCHDENHNSQDNEFDFMKMSADLVVKIVKRLRSSVRFVHFPHYMIEEEEEMINTIVAVLFQDPPTNGSPIECLELPTLKLSHEAILPRLRHFKGMISDDSSVMKRHS